MVSANHVVPSTVGESEVTVTSVEVGPLDNDTVWQPTLAYRIRNTTIIFPVVGSKVSFTVAGVVEIAFLPATPPYALSPPNVGAETSLICKLKV